MTNETTQFKPAAEEAQKGEVSVSQAAEILGRTPIAIRQQIYAGRLPAEKRGNTYFIKKKDLELIRNLKGGFPKGAKRSGGRGKKVKK